MKVLFTANIPSPYRVDFFNELGKQCELTVLFEREYAKDREYSWTGNGIESFRAVFLKGLQAGNDSAFCPGILKYLSLNKYDVIVIGGYSTYTGMLAIEYMKLGRISFILNSDGGLIKPDSHVRYRIKSHFISAASAWLSTGRMTTEYLIHYGANAKNISVYPFTSLWEKDILEKPPSQLEKQSIRRKLGIQENKVILSVGQFIPRKGYDVLLNACFNMDTDIGMYIIGGEPTVEYLRMKENLHLEHTYFIGFKKKKELAEFYKAADLFVLPTREDIWGLVINEAMAHALPIVTTEKCIAGVELVEPGENGFIIPIEDTEALSAAIKKILSNEEPEKMMESSIRKIQSYTIEKMVSFHLSFFESDIRNRQAKY